MIYLGSKGNAADQLHDLLKLKESDEKIQLDFASYLMRLMNMNSNNEIEFAHLIFINERLKYNGAFQSMLNNYFSSDIIPNNFINQTKWVNSIIHQKTNSKIKTVVGQGLMTNTSAVLLTDAIYFSGSWIKPFSKENTLPKKFYLKKKQDIKVMTMHLTAKFEKFKSQKPKCEILELPFENQISMYIILPRKGVDIRKFEKRLPESIFQNILYHQGFKMSLVTVDLPTFFMTTRVEMKYYLKSLGITDIFDPNLNDFSRIVRGPISPQVNKIIQKTVMKCEEGESEKSFNILNFGCKNSFKVNRPFIFLVVDRMAKIILLMGRIVNPNVRYFYGPI